jgi:hypothetical protein
MMDLMARGLGCRWAVQVVQVVKVMQEEQEWQIVLSFHQAVVVEVKLEVALRKVIPVCMSLMNLSSSNSRCVRC